MPYDKLAINGGKKAVSFSHPHTKRLDFTDSDKKAIEKYLESDLPNSEYGKSGIVQKLEDEIKSYFNVSYALAANSGTSALHSAYFALGLQEGDEVIVPTNTFFATATPLFQLGIVPVLADCDFNTGNISPKSIRENISSKTKAIAVTHLWGLPADMNEIMAIAKENNLFVVEDISISFGTKINETKVGTFGDIACFSMGSTKLLSGGQGGALITNNKVHYYRASLLGQFGTRLYQDIMDPYYRSFIDIGYGLNYRIHVLAAAIALNRLQNVEDLFKMRHERFELLESYLSKTKLFILPTVDQNVFKGAWQGFHVKINKELKIEKKDVVNMLHSEGCEIAPIPSYPLLHTTKYFKTYNDGLKGININNKNKKIFKNGDLPIAEKFIQETIFFPLFLDEPLDLIREYGEACQKVDNHLKTLI